MSHELNNINEQNANFPLRESAFYSQIKSSTETGDSASFALIMSMLTTDAKELDEFHLPHTVDDKIKSDLYDQFHIQQGQLTGKFNNRRSLAYNELIHQGEKAAVALDLKLNPEPLIATTEKFSSQLLDNLEPNVRSRLAADLTSDNDESSKQPMVAKVEKEIDVESWFQVLHESRTLSFAV